MNYPKGMTRKIFLNFRFCCCLSAALPTKNNFASLVFFTNDGEKVLRERLGLKPLLVTLLLNIKKGEKFLCKVIFFKPKFLLTLTAFINYQILVCMKNITVYVCASIILVLSAFREVQAQDKLISFGKPDKTELELKDCDFDLGAPVECLADAATVTYQITVYSGRDVPVGLNSNSSSASTISNTSVNIAIVTNRREKFKVFKDAGISTAADIKIRYYSKDRYESISGVDGYVYNTDTNGNVTVSRLKKSDVYNKKVDDEYSEVSFAMPDVRVGSVVEFRYTKYRKTVGNIESWYFQHTYPVKYSAYNLIIPTYFNFTYQVNRRQDADIIKSSDADNNNNWFIMRNVASVHDEPYMSGFNDYNQRVDFNLASITFPREAPIAVGSTWQKLAEQYLDANAYGSQINRNVRHPADLDSAVAACKNNTDKIKTVYNYLQKNMRWNGEEDFASREDGGIKSAWDKRQGNTADINLLLIDWLRDYKINAAPLLVSTHDNGKPNTFYVDIDQFNSVMAFAQADDSTAFVLDASDKYGAFGMIPYNVQFSDGLLADSKNSRWIPLEDYDKKIASETVINLTIAKNGDVSGFGDIRFYDYARNRVMKDVQESKMKDLKSEFSLSKNITLNADSIELPDMDKENNPLKIGLTFSGSAQSSGNYLLVPYNLYTGFTENPFTSDKRQTAVDFRCLQSYSVMGYINIDDGLAFESLPKNISIRIADSSILMQRIFQKNNEQSVNYVLSINVLRPIYTLEEYADVKAFFKQLFQLLDERIVVKKVSD